jgi:hypothetical protein
MEIGLSRQVLDKNLGLFLHVFGVDTNEHSRVVKGDPDLIGNL